MRQRAEQSEGAGGHLSHRFQEMVSDILASGHPLAMWSQPETRMTEADGFREADCVLSSQRTGLIAASQVGEEGHDSHEVLAMSQASLVVRADVCDHTGLSRSTLPPFSSSFPHPSRTITATWGPQMDTASLT